jgi:hypothetical protein
MPRLFAALLSTVFVVVGACGGGGPTAPPVGDVERICGDNFCVDVPVSWEIVEATDEFVSLRHPLAPEEIVATVGQVNMEGIVTADGKEWPQNTDAVVRSFWNLIDGGGAELATVDPLRDGSVETFGTFASGRLWYRLTPLEGSSAIGIEVRGPDSSWASHAEIIMCSLVVLGR